MDGILLCICSATTMLSNYFSNIVISRSDFCPAIMSARSVRRFHCDCSMNLVECKVAVGKQPNQGDDQPKHESPRMTWRAASVLTPSVTALA
jgi:hypothetical protein